MTRKRTSALLVACLLTTSLLGCENLRYYTSYQYKHVRREVTRSPTGEREYMSGIYRQGDAWVLRVMELRTCEHKTVEIAEETAKIKVRAPTWYWFLGLGALQTTVSTPFWVLGARSVKSSEATKQYLVGTFVFLVPGLAIMSVGLYYKLRTGTYYKKLGVRRRVRKSVTLPCGVVPAVGRGVRLGTRTGQLALGKTDAKGQLSLPGGPVRPLVRWKDGKVEKAYFDVFVEQEPGHEVRLPKAYPVHAADLREPKPGK
ncbi:MAG: hypothetical protein ABI333_10065 [bacterium]